MKKPAERRNTDTPEDEIQGYMDALNAKQQFIGATLNMSWRLALTVLIPVVGGVKLDQYFDTAPSLTLAGFMLAAFGAAMAVASTVKEVNELQAEADEKENKGNKNS